MEYPQPPKGDHDSEISCDIKINQIAMGSENDAIADRQIFMDFSKTPKNLPKTPEIDLLFPKIRFSKASFDTPWDPNRFYDFTYSIFFFFFVTSVKYFIVKKFEIATFCDIQQLEEFDQKILKNETFMISTMSCTDKCNEISNIALTKIFESNYYFFYSINVFFLMHFILRQKFKGPLLIFLTVVPFPNNFIGHAIYFWNKSYAFMIGNFLYTFEVLIMIKASLLYLKMFSVGLLFIGFFSGIKFFFEVAFPLLVEKDPERTLAVVPILLFFIKFFGKVLFSHYPYFKRCEPKTIVNMLIAFIFFEYIYIGTLHTVVNKYGLASYNFWLTMMQSFLMDILGRTNFLTRIYMMFAKKWNRKKKEKDEDSLFYLYYGIKEELEIYSRLIYFLLLSTHYYDYCMTPLVDCMGSPMNDISPITSEHFLLVVIMILESVVGFLIGLFNCSGSKESMGRRYCKKSECEV